MIANSSVIGEDKISIPVGYSERSRAEASNPVATTLEYRNLIDNLLNILMGVDHEKNKKGVNTLGKEIKVFLVTYMLLLE